VQHGSGTLLVTASSCWSGSGGLKSGEGVMGLRRAFAQAGARHSLLSLWPVDDETTQQMRGGFYEQLFGGQNPPTAWSVTQADWLAKLAEKSGPGIALYLAGPMVMNSSCQP
jgi:CHAT domain-containing protein